MRTRKEIELDLVENRENNFYDEITENQYIMIEVLLDIREILQVQLTGKKTIKTEKVIEDERR